MRRASSLFLLALALGPSPRASAEGPPDDDGAYDLVGRVLDTNGSPVAGVPVVALEMPPRSRTSAGTAIAWLTEWPAVAQPVAEATSGADGRFVLQGILRRLPCQVHARPAPPLLGSLQHLMEGQDHLDDLTLVVARASGRLRGRTVDAEGRGIAAAITAWVNDPRERPTMGVAGWMVPEFFSDVDGRFDVAGVPEGACSLSIRVPGRGYRHARVDVSAVGDVVVPVATPGGMTIYGRIADMEGRGVAGATVFAQVSMRALKDGSPEGAVTTTDADGNYRLGPIARASQIDVLAWAPGFRRVELRDQTLEPAPDARIPVYLTLRQGATLQGRVRGEDGRAVAGAAVTLPTREQGGRLQSYETTTDSEGRYRLEGLFPGAETVFARTPSRDGAGPRSAALAVTLGESGETTADLTLVPHAEVRGRVLDAAGAPVPGALVVAKPAPMPSTLLLPPAARARADASGAFLVPLDLSRAWTVTAVLGAGRGVAEVPPVRTNERPPSVEIRLVQSSVISGKVLDEHGAPVGGVQVVTGSGRVAVSGAEGSFRIEGVPPGTWDVRTMAIGGSKEASATVEVPAGGAVEGVVLRLPSFGMLRGVLVDPSGAPIPNEHIVFAGSERRSSRLTFAMTDREGRFHVAIAPAGRYLATVRNVTLPATFTTGPEPHRLVLEREAGPAVVIRLMGHDHSPVPRASITITAGRAGERVTSRHEVRDGVLVLPQKTLRGPVDLCITDARDAEGAPLRLRTHAVTIPGNPQGELVFGLLPGARVAGVVTDEADSPVPGVRVLVRSPTVAPLAPEVDSAVTNEAGRFEVVTLPPGDLEVSVHPDEWLQVAPVRAPDGVSEVRVRVRRGRTIRVRVLGPTAEPVAGATVVAKGSWMEKPWLRNAATDDEGRARLTGVSPAGDVHVEVDARSARPSLPAATVRGDAPEGQEVIVRLERGARILGSVVDEAGNAVSVAAVEAVGLVEEAGRTDSVGLTGPTNQFVLGPLRAGAYRLTARAAGYAGSVPIEVTAPAEGVRVVLRRAASVEARVEGEDVGGFQAEWIVGDARRTAIVGSDGFVRIEEAGDGVGTLLVRRVGDARYGLVRDARPSEGPVRVVLVEGGRIAGRITGLGENDPLPALSALQGALALWADVAADGAFEILGVPPGTWRLGLTTAKGEFPDRAEVEAGAKDVVLRLR
jgi:protocatechuate 3,4-dioxygenase beta subunit